MRAAEREAKARISDQHEPQQQKKNKADTVLLLLDEDDEVRPIMVSDEVDEDVMSRT